MPNEAVSFYFKWSGDESHSFRSPQKAGRRFSQAGLLTWREDRVTAASASPSPSLRSSGLFEAVTLTYSGGTVPVLHRTSLLGPFGHLRLFSMTYRAVRLQASH